MGRTGGEFGGEFGVGRRSQSGGRAGFTLMELMITVGIIVILVSILIPSVAKVRKAAQTASTRSLIQNLESAILQYKSTYNAYPGPLPDAVSSATGSQARVGGPFGTGGLQTILPATALAAGFYLPASYTLPPAALPTGVTTFNSVTGTNNLVLGLLGGLFYDAGDSTVKYDPSRVGKGPAGLSPSNGRVTPAFTDLTKDLSWHDQGGAKAGNFLYEGAIPANDGPIPSIVDRYSEPMPIMYLRAAVGVSGRKVTPTSTTDNPVVVSYQSAVAATVPWPYNLAHVTGYTSSAIGLQGTMKDRIPDTETGHGLLYFNPTGLTALTKAARYPFEANAYLTDPSLSGSPRKKDEYVLISAGPDRIYGTPDDVTSFGDVIP